MNSIAIIHRRVQLADLIIELNKIALFRDEHKIGYINRLGNDPEHLCANINLSFEGKVFLIHTNNRVYPTLVIEMKKDEDEWIKVVEYHAKTDTDIQWSENEGFNRMAKRLLNEYKTLTEGAIR